jgi:hypothetical protein
MPCILLLKAREKGQTKKLVGKNFSSFSGQSLALAAANHANQTLVIES